MLSLAYKENTGVLCESPPLALCESLVNLAAEVRVDDVYMPDHQAVAWPQVEPSNAGLEAADLVVFVTDYDAVDYERVVPRSKPVFDTRRRTVPGPTAEHL